MFLIFKLHKRGYPVNQIYEDEVKAFSTRRFNDGFMESSIQLGSGENSNIHNFMTPDD